QTLVENQGDQSENFNLTVGYNNETIQTLQITSLPPHQVYTLTLVWNTTEVSVGNYTLKAWAPPVPGEIDLADNQHVDGEIQILTPIIPNIAILDVTPN
ncbi:hypothetical protein GWN63_00020, partial [Candidatus Bathyarchaeota archaeon]|nr:hypothetical protein [Candidatus Bathyarchaeota archaeon]NIR16432.1 hypothetical protein [Desulfobacterales bacterium]NIU80628.1 hypothetical protein [Candidatus Bathyarchaeota archaeon]NIV68168.1 hypothetical protein [Candidatus Bathyarchaeota archaeon]NIW33944.1 hypothetical protein [Candidatus Bathyarchaeota archaeon]